MPRVTQATVPEPYQDVRSLRSSVMALKELVEVLCGQRGDGTERAITVQDVRDAGFDQVSPLRMTVSRLDTPGTYTYTKSLGLRYLLVELCGGGGGSGGCAATSSTQTSAGGGGGGSAYCRKLYDADDLANNEPFVVGARGLGGTGTGNGTAGGASTFKGMSAGGGGGGAYSTAQTALGMYIGRGAAGNATGGDLNVHGTSGQGGFCNVHGDVGLFQPGYGGQNNFSGNMYFPPASGSQHVPTDVPDNNIGLGANGAANGISKAAQNGADGGPGMVILTEFF